MHKEVKKKEDDKTFIYLYLTFNLKSSFCCCRVAKEMQHNTTIPDNSIVNYYFYVLNSDWLSGSSAEEAEVFR